MRLAGSRALSDHAEKAWQELKDDPSGSYRAAPFLLLCEVSPDGQITRRRPKWRDPGGDWRHPRRNHPGGFVRFRKMIATSSCPRLDDGLTPDTPLDLSHEALLRRWQLFASEWLEQERRDTRRSYGVSRTLATLHNSGQGGLLQGQDLQRVTNWRDRISAEWAHRYLPKGRWDEAVAFMDASEREHPARKAATAKARKRALNLARWAALTSAAIAALLIAAIVRHRYLYVWENTAYFNSFAKVNGAPTGVGLLTAQQVQHRPWSTRIVKKGRRGLVLRMEAVNSRGEPTRHHSVGGLFRVRPGTEEVRWDFQYSSDDRVAYEVAYDKRGKHSGR